MVHKRATRETVDQTKKRARKDLAAAFERGVGTRVKIARGIKALREKAFEKTLARAIDDYGSEYWNGKAKTFALRNAKAIGRVAATLAEVAGRDSVDKDDYARAANLVIAKAQEQCPPGPDGEQHARGPQCIAWGSGLEV